jgi:sugar phosphate isomerase/epimerase
MRRGQIALQLYTVRELATRDMIGTLRQLAEMGYGAVEFAGFGGVPPDELRAVLDELGMRAASAHVPLGDWTDDPGRVLADLDVLGCRHAAVPIMAPEHRESEETVARFAEDLNGIAAVCEVAGIGLSYHNHDFEFARLGDATLWEVLVRETDPRLVGLEVDVYWARYAGVDPEGLLRDVADRVSVLHLKDMAPDEERSDAPVGEGTMPWDRLLAAGDAAGVEWYVVEQDHPNDPMQDVRRSLENLERMADG